jgi:hypothetical protein
MTVTGQSLTAELSTFEVDWANSFSLQKWKTEYYYEMSKEATPRGWLSWHAEGSPYLFRGTQILGAKSLWLLNVYV